MPNKTLNSILTKLVSVKSYIPHETRPYAFISSQLKTSGFKLQRQKVRGKRENLLAKKGEGKTSILIYMHIDTIFPTQGWKHRPLKLHRAGDKYTGLGCFDMKGGIAAILSSISLISLKKHRLKLAFCVDEEEISQGAYSLVNSTFVKDVKVALSPEACIIPSKWELPVVMATGGRGRCVLVVEINSKPHHGADDGEHVDVVKATTNIVKNLEKWKPVTDAKLGKSSFFIRKIHGESSGLSTPEKVTLEIDYQMVDAQTPENVKKSLKEHLRRTQKFLRDQKMTLRVYLKLRETPYIKPYTISKSNPYLKLVTSILKQRYGKSGYSYAKSVADQNVLAAAGIPTITIGPIGGKAHEAGEWVSRSSLEEMVELYKEIFQRL